MKKTFAILLFTLGVATMCAQQVTDVSFSLRGDSLAITYSLDR